MKTAILFLAIFSATCVIGQDTIQSPETISLQTHSQIFSLSPMSKKVDEVNGLVFGLGHIDNKHISEQKINGINVEINPAPIAGTFLAFIAVVHLPDIIVAQTGKNYRNVEDDSFMKINDFRTNPHIKLNGINLSSGCFFTQTSMNGLNISLGNKFNKFNGLSLSPLGTIAGEQSGVSIGIINANNNLQGATFGLYNQSQKLNGLQLGLINRAKINKGLQIGLYNKSFSKGFQLGIWNKNSKRAMPFLNW